jgi:hypothetical protein
MSTTKQLFNANFKKDAVYKQARTILVRVFKLTANG